MISAMQSTERLYRLFNQQPMDSSSSIDPSFGGYSLSSCIFCSKISLIQIGNSCFGLPTYMDNTSPPGGYLSNRERSRGNAYSGRFENRSGKSIIASILQDLMSRLRLCYTCMSSRSSGISNISLKRIFFTL